MNKKLAILGASYLQRPLVEKAKELDIETHVFAWKEGNVVEAIADYYYPISILEREQILEECKRIGIDGITSIASDIAMPTVNYVAGKLDLVGNRLEATKISTDKYKMRKALKKAGIPCPKFKMYAEPKFNEAEEFEFPVIVKPTDRSGSRGVTKVDNPKQTNVAIKKALDSSINKRVIVEEFIEGREFSIEMISFKDEHHFLAITDKITTGAPYFVEIEHHQPAQIDNKVRSKIINVVKNALDALKLKNGASHSEVLLTRNGKIRIVEIAGRMGGDLIGSHMVPLSTGVDFVKAVIEIAIGEYKPEDYQPLKKGYSGVYYVIPESGIIKRIIDNTKKFPEVLDAIPIYEIGDEVPNTIDGADKRAGIITYQSNKGKVNLEPNNVLSFITE